LTQRRFTPRSNHLFGYVKEQRGILAPEHLANVLANQEPDLNVGSSARLKGFSSAAGGC